MRSKEKMPFRFLPATEAVISGPRLRFRARHTADLWMGHRLFDHTFLNEARQFVHAPLLKPEAFHYPSLPLLIVAARKDTYNTHA